ncbi:MAG: GDSL-type esterase/lipase family protein, partial [Myxococcaceae bacterium]
MRRLHRHATGLTLATALALTVGLSLSPLPDALRPYPSLRTRPVTTVATVLWPQRSRPAVPPLPDPVGGGQVVASVTPAPRPAEAEPLLPAPRADVAAALSSLSAPLRAEAREDERLKVAAGARHVEIEQGCLLGSPGGACATRALAPFFRALEAAALRPGSHPVRVLHLGDSLIASDHITDVVRARMQDRFGAGGRGFLFVDRPVRGAGRAVRAGTATEGWRVDKLTDGRPPPPGLGFTGMSFASEASSEGVTFDTGRARSAEVYFLGQPRGGTFEARADGKLLGRILTRLDRPEPAFARLPLPDGARQLSLTTRGGPVQLYGVSLEGEGPGLVYDSVGLPGATAEVLLRADRAVFDAQLGHRDPSLVVLMLGGNEAFELGRGWTTPAKVRESFDRLVERVRGAAPGAACLLLGTLDAGVHTLGGEIAERERSREVSDLIRASALENGCAFWDLLSAMGGAGAVRKWNAVGLMSPDLVHPLGSGGDLLGHLMDVALERARLGSGALPLAPDPRGLENAERLKPTFARLRGLEEKREGRVAFAQFGASHTAAHYFTDTLRARLAARFGGRGRGFVAAGRSSPRLAPAGVRRSLTGAWTVRDAMQRPGDIFGLTGISAQGGPGASWETSFCVGCAPGSARALLQLYYLLEPAMGTMQVLLDGAPVALPIGSPVAPAAQVVEFEAAGAPHTITVTNLGPGPVTVFGAAEELDVPGVI